MITQCHSTGNEHNMAQKADTVNVTINMSSAAATNTTTEPATAVTKSHKTNRKPFRGHGWSTSKKQRRLLKQKTKLKQTKNQNFAYYAVYKGRWPGKIHTLWAECEANVKEFSGCHYKGFHHRIAAVDWLRDENTKEAFKKMMQKHNNTKAVQSACVNTSTPDVVNHAIPVATATLITTVPPTVPPTTIPTVNAVPVATAPPPIVERDFSAVAELARLIAASPVDGLSPPPECSSKTCPYCCGEVSHIQQILLQRFYQTAILTMHQSVGHDYKL